jgi:hypothetical protein
VDRVGWSGGGSAHGRERCFVDTIGGEQLWRETASKRERVV